MNLKKIIKAVHDYDNAKHEPDYDKFIELQRLEDEVYDAIEEDE